MGTNHQHSCCPEYTANQGLLSPRYQPPAIGAEFLDDNGEVVLRHLALPDEELEINDRVERLLAEEPLISSK